MIFCRLWTGYEPQTELVAAIQYSHLQRSLEEESKAQSPNSSRNRLV